MWSTHTNPAPSSQRSVGMAGVACPCPLRFPHFFCCFVPSAPPSFVPLPSLLNRSVAYGYRVPNIPPGEVPPPPGNHEVGPLSPFHSPNMARTSHLGPGQLSGGGGVAFADQPPDQLDQVGHSKHSVPVPLWRAMPGLFCRPSLKPR